MASGNGSNLQALLDACRDGTIPATITNVIVNRKTAYAMQRAAAAGVPCEYVNLVKGGYHTAGEKDAEKLAVARSRYDADLARIVVDLRPRPDLIVLAGWMHVFTPDFLDPIAKAGIDVINLHPALPGSIKWKDKRDNLRLTNLLGKYDGANAIERQYADYQAGRLEKAGVMVHYVIAQVDGGDPILVQEVDCSKEDSLQDLEERIHSVEHGLLVSATAQIAKSIIEKKSA